jgi:hypothetical protein
VDAIAIRQRWRSLDRPPTHSQLQSIVVVGLALLIASLFVVGISDAENPAVALGIALQTITGLLASVQLWASRAADVAVNWVARQIGRKRRSILGLLDGRPLSMFLAAGFYVIARLLATELWSVSSPGLGRLSITLLSLLVFAVAACAFVLAMFMFVGSVLLPRTPLPDGAAVTGACSRLMAQRWIWPAFGCAFVLGGLLQTLGG